MLLAFTDESYSEDIYVQTAYLIKEEKLDELYAKMNEAKQFAMKFGITFETEFHGYSIMNNSDGWEALKGKFNVKEAIYKKCLAMISEIEGVVIVQGVDFKAMKNQYINPYPPEEESNKHLLDAIDKYAESQHDYVIIYSDEAPQQKRLGELFLKYKITSTGGPYPRFLKNVIRVEYIDSKSHVGIQIADLIVYIYRRMEDHFKGNEFEQERVRKLWRIIEPCIDPTYRPRIWP
jgi:Protein of unknown function (DUF3800)